MTTTQNAAESAPKVNRQEIVRRLLQVISNELPMDEAAHLLDARVTATMDGKKISSGRRPWQKWVLFMRRTAKMRGIDNLHIVVDSMLGDGEEIEVRAKWYGLYSGKEVFSDAGKVVYRVQNGKITAIHTHKSNYVFICGNKIKQPFFFYLLLLRVMFFRPNRQQ